MIYEYFYKKHQYASKNSMTKQTDYTTLTKTGLIVMRFFK